MNEDERQNDMNDSQRSDYLLGWKITPVFNISQKERTILALIKHHLKCGTLRYRKDCRSVVHVMNENERQNDVWVYEVETRTALRERIIPFFTTFRFLSEKQKADFRRFQRILGILDRHRSTTFADLERILVVLDEVESKAARIYSHHQILERATVFWTKNRHRIEAMNAAPLGT